MPYLDYNASTPVDDRVVEAIMPALRENFGNPASMTHMQGEAAAGLVADARGLVAAAVGRTPSDVIFTSGATEANNMVLFGAGKLTEPLIIVGSAEHKSVLQAADHTVKYGAVVKLAPVDQNGMTDLETLAEIMEPDTDIVSIGAANSETGVIQPAKEIARIAHEHGALFHCDATQAVGKIPFNAADVGADIVTLSSHKIYGPKGAGAVVADREARKSMIPTIFGGGQEDGLRSGTPNVPGIAGFGVACSLAVTEGIRDANRQRDLRDKFELNLKAAIEGVTVNGFGAERLPNTSNFRIEGALADAVILSAQNISISSGSACTSATMEPSHVLTAMGLDRTAADESIRVSIGRPTVSEDLDTAVSEITSAVRHVRGVENKTVEELV